jgi:tetratricopeptide (TPR) repeat protein
MKTFDKNHGRVTGLLLLVLAGLLLSGCSTKPKEPPVVRNEKNRATGFLSQGNKQFDAGLYDPARESYKKALSIFGSINDDDGIIDSLLSLARAGMVLGGGKETAELLTYAESYALMTKKPHLIRSVYNFRGEFLLKNGDYEGALALCADDKVPGLSGDSEEAAGMFRIRGKALKRLERYPEAAEALKRAIEIDTKLMHEADLAADYYILASVHSLTGDYPRAMETIQKALELDRKIESKSGIAADLAAMATIYEKSGDNESALVFWHKAYLAWRGMGLDSEKKEAADAIRRLSGNTAVFLP